MATFTNSSLVSMTKISPYKNAPRNHAIDTITIHCAVGQLSVESLANCFQDKNRQVSCNYCIGTDGRIALIVEEKDRSWCSSSRENDHRAITIECASDAKAPYAINDQVYKSLVKLVADICQRNNIKELRWQGNKALIGQVDKQNITLHRWFAPTECPGDYIVGKIPTIVKDVNDILNPKVNADKPVPFMVRVTTDNVWIRKGPGTNYLYSGKNTGKGTFTIVETSGGIGSSRGWGRLKSGAGWINLDLTDYI